MAAFFMRTDNSDLVLTINPKRIIMPFMVWVFLAYNPR